MLRRIMVSSIEAIKTLKCLLKIVCINVFRIRKKFEQIILKQGNEMSETVILFHVKKHHDFLNANKILICPEQ